MHDKQPAEKSGSKRIQAELRVAQFDRQKIQELCGCWCKNGFCYPCGFVSLDPPPSVNAVRFGLNTPDGE